jgi:ubiquinone/menaquinone biosynthesis C-methylase UbiE
LPQLGDRKLDEVDLHDRLRGSQREDPTYRSNERFYAVTRSSVEFVRTWLREHCPGKKVLDYCCGDGPFTLWLAEAGAEVYGIDISPVSIDSGTAAAARRGLSGRAVFRVMDAEAMTFPDATFDVAIVHGVLHHLDLDRAYAELARVLKPGGQVICTEALRHNPIIQRYRRRTPHLRTAWEVDHILGKPEIEQAHRYFESVKVAGFFHLATIAAVPFRGSRVFPALLRALEAADSFLLKIPILRWQAWMAVFVLSQPKHRNT